jgi:DNA-binding transcriptional LysR family regulator
MEFSDFKYFIATADCGNFAGAARLLGLNTSTISRAIANLEDELGLSLFERSASGARLTPGGEDVLKHARRVSGEIEAVRAIGQLRAIAGTGEIKLGFRIPNLGDPIRALLSDWRHAHPDVAIHAFDLNDIEAAGALISRRLDAIFVPDFNLWPHAEALPIFNENFVAAVPAQHPLAKQLTLNWRSFEGSTLLIQSSDDNHAKRQFFAPLLESGVRFQPHGASMPTILGLVGSGFGLALVQSGMTSAAFPDVVFRPIDEESAAFQVHLAWHPQAEDPTVGRFVAFMRDQSRLRKLI